MSQVILRALRSRIAEVIQQKKLLIGQALLTTDATNKALLVATGPDSTLEFLPTSEKCFFNYYLSSSQSLSSGVYSVVRVNTAWVASSYFDTSTWQFTVPNSGFYCFHGAVYASSTTSMYKLGGLVINGGNYVLSKVPTTAATAHMNVAMGPLFLAAGDTISLMAMANAANTLPAMTASTPFLGSHFSGWRVG